MVFGKNFHSNFAHNGCRSEFPRAEVAVGSSFMAVGKGNFSQFLVFWLDGNFFNFSKFSFGRRFLRLGRWSFFKGGDRLGLVFFAKFRPHRSLLVGYSNNLY